MFSDGADWWKYNEVDSTWIFMGGNVRSSVRTVPPANPGAEGKTCFLVIYLFIFFQMKKVLYI